ncbi:MAG: hypothetical protein ACHQHK_02445 [Dongiales bacterium]
MTRNLCIGLAMAAWLIAAAGPTLAGEVPCDGFALGYDGEAKKKTCSVEDNSTADLELETKVLRVSDQTFSLWVSYDHAGMRTYIPSHSVTELLHSFSFTNVQQLGVSRHIRGFDVVAFTGVPKGDNFLLTCALFARYTGNPGNYEFDGGPGTRNATMGIYCADPGFLTPAEEKEGFYNVAEQVIAKLKLPPVD